MSRCVILSAGPVSEPAALLPLLRPDDMLLAADGGWQLAAALGVTPQAVVADFDSASPTVVPRSVELVRLPIRKDVTDKAAAAEYAWERGYRDFLFLGCTGGRLDHQHAAILTAWKLCKQGGRCVIADARNRIEIVTQSPYVAQPMPGWSLSLFALDGPVHGLTLRGMEYDLTEYDLHPTDALCVSNACTAEEGSITFRDGALLLYRSKD